MKRRHFSAALASLPLLPLVPARAAVPVQVYKDPNCGCCTAWADHLRQAGFAVQITDSTDLAAVRKRLGMPERFAGCHTAVVEGYVLEGHVPAAEVRKLLAMKPRAIGLSVPGMPVGSPGMEVGERQDPYQVLLIDRGGKERVFARYPTAS